MQAALIPPQQTPIYWGSKGDELWLSYDNRIVRGATTVADTMDAGLRAHMLRVYN